MPKLDVDGEFASFRCPGCEEFHMIRIRADGAARPSWEWNGDAECPTLEPSIRVSSSRPEGAGMVSYTVCHSYVRKGRIEFLSDCLHALAGKTVDLPDV